MNPSNVFDFKFFAPPRPAYVIPFSRQAQIRRVSGIPLSVPITAVQP
jgi:hypothetical protein